MNDVPQLPGHLGSEDVKGLIRMQFTIALVVIKESVVGILVPLKKKEMICLKGRSMPVLLLPQAVVLIWEHGGTGSWGEGARQNPGAWPLH